MLTRRVFLEASAGASVAAAAAPAAAAPATPAPFDLQGVAARLARPVRHRQVLASARVASGTAPAQAQHTLDAYEHGYGEGPGTVHIAIVFYSKGVIQGLRGEAWTKYGLADFAKKHNDVVDTGDGNPYEKDLNDLAARGATFLVCNNALTGLSEALAGANATEGGADAIHAALRTMLVNGAYVVPAGVAALNQAQEAQFTYLASAI